MLDKNADCDNYIVTKEEYSVETGETHKTKMIQKGTTRKEDKNFGTTWHYNNLWIMGIHKEYRRVMGTTIYTLKDEFNIYVGTDEKNYQYRGKENYQSKECIVVEFKNAFKRKDGSEPEKVYDVRQWIELETGLLLKEEQYVGENIETIITYDIQTNCVTEEDLDLPNLEEYTLREGQKTRDSYDKKCGSLIFLYSSPPSKKAELIFTLTVTSKVASLYFPSQS